MFKIIIIDRRGERRKRMIESFPCEGVNSQSYWHGAPPEFGAQCNLLLFHYGDDEQCSPGRINSISWDLAVYYGAGGEPDSRWPYRKAMENSERIWQRVDVDGEGALSPDEAQELIKYTISLKKNGAVPKPKFLQSPQDYTTLSAITILCQGHLIAYADESAKQKKEVKDALNEMGCNPSTVAQLAEKLNTPESSSALWFVLSETDIQCARTEWNDLTEGKKVPDSVNNLLGEVGALFKANEGQAPEIKAITAASAYLDIASKLRGL